MARYIDLEKAIPTAIQACVDVVGHGITQVDAVNIALKFEEIATADVAPKSEVASTAHKCKDCAGCTQWKCDCANIELEVAREIFEDIWEMFIPEKSATGCAYYFDMYELVELKKKYTEDSDES